MMHISPSHAVLTSITYWIITVTLSRMKWHSFWLVIRFLLTSQVYPLRSWKRKQLPRCSNQCIEISRNKTPFHPPHPHSAQFYHCSHCLFSTADRLVLRSAPSLRWCRDQVGQEDMLSVNCNIKIDLFITIINFIIHSNLAYYLSRIFMSL